MSRRRIIWALVAFVVTLTIGMLLGATEARADTGSAHDATMMLGAAVLLVAGMAALCLLGVGAMRLTDWVWQNRPPSKRERAAAETFNTAVEQAMHVANHHCDGDVCPVCEPTRTAVEGMVAWAAEQDRLELERLWAMDEAEEPRRS